MSEQTTRRLIEALKPWMNEAIGHIRPHREQWAEVVKCMNGNGDVRVVFYARENIITVEAADHDESTVTEVFREFLFPAECGFALRCRSRGAARQPHDRNEAKLRLLRSLIGISR